MNKTHYYLILNKLACTNVISAQNTQPHDHTKISLSGLDSTFLLTTQRVKDEPGI